jgi:hypothetical protein
MTDLIVGLHSWIIQDGNYGEFTRGMTAAFALEFFSTVPILELGPSDNKIPSLHHVSEDSYQLVGQVVHKADDWWVIDAGLLVYSDQPPPDNVHVGTWLRGGLIQIGIDPFFYFERLAHQPDALAMVYEWRIDKIEEQTAPLIEIRPKQFARDPAKLGWKEIVETRAWEDSGEYLLHCTRLDGPRRPRSKSRP